MIKMMSLAVLASVIMAGNIFAYSYLAFEQITVAGTAIGFTSTKITPAGAPQQPDTAVCRLETAQIRYTIDGTTPTSTVGTLLETGDTIAVYGHDVLVRFRAIRTGSSGQLNCTYSAP